MHVLQSLNETELQHKKTVEWTQCNDNVNMRWNQDDWGADVTPLYGQLVNRGIKILIFSGDSDSVCSTMGTQAWLYDIPNVHITSQWQEWSIDPSPFAWQTAGYITKFSGGLTFSTVRNAGHEVPMYRPAEAYTLFQRYLNGSELFAEESFIGKSPWRYETVFGKMTAFINVTLDVHCPSMKPYLFFVEENKNIFQFVTRGVRHVLEHSGIVVQFANVVVVDPASKLPKNAVKSSAKAQVMIRIDEIIKFEHITADVVDEPNALKVAEGVNVANGLVSAIMSASEFELPLIDERLSDTRKSVASIDATLASQRRAHPTENRRMPLSGGNKENDEIDNFLRLAALQRKELIYASIMASVEDGRLDQFIQTALAAAIDHKPPEVSTDLQIILENVVVTPGVFGLVAYPSSMEIPNAEEWDPEYRKIVFPDSNHDKTSKGSSDHTPIFIITSRTILVVFVSSLLTVLGLLVGFVIWWYRRSRGINYSKLGSSHGLIGLDDEEEQGSGIELPSSSAY